MIDENKFFSNLRKITEMADEDKIFISVDKRDLPQLVQILESCEDKKEIYAKTLHENLVFSEISDLLFVIKLIVFGKAKYSGFYSPKEIADIKKTAKQQITTGKPIAIKVIEAIKRRRSKPYHVHG